MDTNEPVASADGPCAMFKRFTLKNQYLLFKEINKKKIRTREQII